MDNLTKLERILREVKNLPAETQAHMLTQAGMIDNDLEDLMKVEWIEDSDKLVFDGEAAMIEHLNSNGYFAADDVDSALCMLIDEDDTVIEQAREFRMHALVSYLIKNGHVTPYDTAKDIINAGLTTNGYEYEGQLLSNESAISALEELEND